MKKVTAVTILLLLTLAWFKMRGSESGIKNVYTSPVGSLEDYDIKKYAPYPHNDRVRKILEKMSPMYSEQDVHDYISSKSKGKSHITGKMVWESTQKHSVDIHLVMALMQQDSQFGTKGLAVKSKNPGNIGTYGGKIRYNCSSWNEGVDRVSRWISENRIYKEPVEDPPDWFDRLANIFK
ncbi:MAG: glucosaminidase domain-containing protein [Candidatus Pacebacteria bacterium]|nr:glucosaminidase domain-containing protein [Candidatus Paceibacterota bacterium]